jgi:hypothetical protein
MSAKQVLDGINTLRDVINHPTLSDAEKIAALKVSVEEVRNDIQDLASDVFANFVAPVPDTASSEEEDAAYEQLNKQEVNDLIFFYKKSVFARIRTAPARLSLARILIRIANEKEVTAPSLWLTIAASAGEMNED